MTRVVMAMATATAAEGRKVYPGRHYTFETRGARLFLVELGRPLVLPTESRTIVNLTPKEWASFQRTPRDRRGALLHRLCGPLPEPVELRVRFDPPHGVYGTRWRRVETQACVRRGRIKMPPDMTVELLRTRSAE